MKKISYLFIALIVLFLFAGAASADTIGGDKGVIQVKCDVNGASASLLSINNDLIETKTITNGMAEFYVYTTATPASQVIVSADGYYTASAPVTVPASGETTQVTVTLEAKPVGGDRGFLQVNTNIIGAKVDVMSISGSVAETGYTDVNGKIEFAIFTTGTPISSVVVSAPGWVTQTVSVTVPAKGQTETVNIEMKSSSPTTAPTTSTPTPTPTTSPMGFALIGLLGVIGVIALVRRD